VIPVEDVIDLVNDLMAFHISFALLITENLSTFPLMYSRSHADLNTRLGSLYTEKSASKLLYENC
jgi:hypothetical protein